MAVRSNILRWLLWLRWKMLLRGYTRRGKAGAILGTIGIFFFIVFFVGSMATGTFFAYRFAPAPANIEVLFLVLTGVFVVWLFLPLMLINVNEGLDLSKLTQFPLRRAELVSSLVLSTILDIFTLALFLIFGAVVAGFAVSLPVTLMVLLVLVVFYVQVIAASQLLLTLLMSVIQVRRLRDLSVILFVILIGLWYVIQFSFQGMRSISFYEGLRNAPYSPILQWLPPGMAARAIQQATLGNWVVSFAWLAGLAVVTLIFLYFWIRLVEYSMVEGGGAGAVGRERRKKGSTLPSPSSAVIAPVSAPATASAGTLARWVPAPVWAIAVKDLKYYRRDPQLTALLVQTVISVFFVVFINLVNGGKSSNYTAHVGPWIMLGAPLFVCFMLFTLSYNVLGMERQSLQSLFLFPVDPRYILWAKNLVSFCIGAVEIILVVVMTGFFTKAWENVAPALAVGLSSIFVVLAFGNITSIFFPQRMKQFQRGFQNSASLSSQQGCLRGVMQLVMMGLLLVVLTPVGLALILPAVFHMRWIWSISVPASVIYGIAIYAVATTLVAPAMLRRAPEIMEVTTRE